MILATYSSCFLLLLVVLLELVLQASTTYPSPHRNTMLLKDGTTSKNMLPRGLTSLLDSVQSTTIAAAGPAARPAAAAVAAVPAVPAAAAGAAAGAGAAGLAAAAAGFQNPLCPDALPLAVGYIYIYIYMNFDLYSWFMCLFICPMLNQWLGKSVCLATLVNKSGVVIHVAIPELFMEVFRC